MIITLKDKSQLELENGLTAMDVAKNISEGLARVALAAKVNGELVGLDTVIDSDAEVEIVTFKDEEGKAIYRHTTAHVLAQAVKNIFPTVKLAIGPSTQNGFYYDFDFKSPITQDDLSRIEDEMKKIIKANAKMERKVVSRRDALKIMKGFKEDYKVELINDLPEDAVISLYTQGDFTDMCRGPHLPSTGYVKAFKLTSLTGAYWKGDEHNKMLTRIYGTAFDKKSELEAYLTAVEEAKKRDHNKLGRELGFFITDENVGQGLPLFKPKGAKLMQLLQRFVEDEEERRGYVLTRTPSMAKSALYKMSGHWDHYRDKMFIIGDEDSEDVLALRPMTCPYQFTIYNSEMHSYKDLPIRYAETANLFRKEASGEMHGLTRVRQFTLADGHIVCTPEQVEAEFKGALDIIYYMLDCFKLTDEVSFRFSKWDPNNREKYIDMPEAWEKTQAIMKQILDNLGLTYEEADGEAAFYGPKLDVQSRNVYGKEDTLFTIQIDFALAERFSMTYVDENGEKRFPTIIHRSSIGSYERTVSMLIEKYAGAFPLWIAPLQVKVMSLTERTEKQALEFVNELRQAGIRAEADIRNEKIGYKIREAQLDKVPYMVILGDKEVEANVIAVRQRGVGDIGTMSKDEFYNKLNKEIREKA
ncbi:MAG: threonine--tRNA ligase [Clostridia bacterium]|nr:threonine--tRNA ligase [Clostridia bacterium]